MVVGMRWADRLIGTISTFILARLLVPDDFGIVAMAWMFVQLIELMMDLGVNVALIRDHQATKAHYDTAWTLRLIQQGLVAGVLVVAAPWVATYFNEPRLKDVLPVMAVGFVLGALQNIWIVDFQKNMQFGRDVGFMLAKRLAGFVATVALAWYLKSYWALIFGTLAAQVTGLLLSYAMHSGRPALGLQHWHSIFRVGIWMAINNIGRYFDNNLPGILIGRYHDASVMGGYSLARDVAAMPTTEILIPLNRVLLPLFSRAARDRHELKRIYLLAQALQSTIGMPAAIGLAAVAPEAVAMLLGEKWLFIVPFVRLCALSSILVAVTTSGNYVMITLGAMRNAAMISWVRVAVFLVAAPLFVPDFDAMSLLVLRLLIVVLTFVLSLWMVMRTLDGLLLTDILHNTFRPALAAVGMAAALVAVEPVVAGSAVAGLFLKVGVGVVVYPLLLWGLWRLAGRPEGAESYLLNLLMQKLQRRMKRRS